MVLATAALAPAVTAGGQARQVQPVGPPGLERREGTATFTDLTGPGACSFLGEPPDNLHVGLSSLEFGTATDCGGYLDVTGPSGTVRVKVTDHCPRCAPGLIDVTRTAFARIADVAAGRVRVSYRLVRNPPLAEAISLRVKTGSSRWWLQIQALDHGNPIARFEAWQDGGWRRLVHTSDNYWTAEDPGLGDGPFTVRITDVFGQQVTVDDVRLAPGEVQPTRARLYPPPGRVEAPRPSPAAPEPSGRPAPNAGPPVLAPPLSFPPTPDNEDEEDEEDDATHQNLTAAEPAADRSNDKAAPTPWPLLLVIGVATLALLRHRIRRPWVSRPSGTRAPRA